MRFSSASLLAAATVVALLSCERDPWQPDLPPAFLDGELQVALDRPVEPLPGTRFTAPESVRGISEAAAVPGVGDLESRISDDASEHFFRQVRNFELELTRLDAAALLESTGLAGLDASRVGSEEELRRRFAERSAEELLAEAELRDWLAAATTVFYSRRFADIALAPGTPEAESGTASLSCRSADGARTVSIVAQISPAHDRIAVGFDFQEKTSVDR